MLLTVLASHQALGAKTITFCTEARPYPPFVYLNEHGEATGLLVDIVKQSAEKSGFKAIFISHPWLRCQKLVEENHAQALFGMIRTPERAALFQFPAQRAQYIAAAEYPIFYTHQSVLYEHQSQLFTQSEFNTDQYRKIRKFGLQAPLGYVVQTFLVNSELTAEDSYTVDEGLEMAANNRLDGYVVERTIGLSRTKSLGLENVLLVSNTPVTKDYWYVPFNKQFYVQNQTLIDTFWQNVENVRGK
ncbi:ABC-type amino acid transport/signal transduction systems, periplasmic component/domain [Pseudoalteromonas luteoviolacea B = ATCC 29581]|nr:ABC-type amino acid transport/signal transduction systems, periplasmic component/domain [Pseudoalteromonas luteoviolacea B = ATCC 29581]